jgi:hypothetical protein
MKRLLPTAVGIVAAAALAGSVGAAAPTVRVSADAGWVATGMQVTGGQTYSIFAVGEAITTIASHFAPVKGGLGAVSGPGGQPYQCVSSAGFTCFVSGAPFGALVARVGADGTPFLIGDASSFTAPATGELFLAVNDFYDDPLFLADNNGGFAVFISD